MSKFFKILSIIFDNYEQNYRKILQKKLLTELLHSLVLNKKNMYFDVTVKPIIEIWTEEARVDMEIGESRTLTPRISIFPEGAEFPEIIYIIFTPL